jgi:hypothetical protein
MIEQAVIFIVIENENRRVPHVGIGRDRIELAGDVTGGQPPASNPGVPTGWTVSGVFTRVTPCATGSGS